MLHRNYHAVKRDCGDTNRRELSKRPHRAHIYAATFSASEGMDIIERRTFAGFLCGGALDDARSIQDL